MLPSWGATSHPTLRQKTASSVHLPLKLTMLSCWIPGFGCPSKKQSLSHLLFKASFFVSYTIVEVFFVYQVSDPRYSSPEQKLSIGNEATGSKDICLLGKGGSVVVMGPLAGKDLPRLN